MTTAARVNAIACSRGETVTCTFTNTKRGEIIVDKTTVPAADPRSSFTFTPSYNGGQTFQLADATAPNNSGGLLAGTYSVSEAHCGRLGPDGHDLHRRQPRHGDQPPAG